MKDFETFIRTFSPSSYEEGKKVQQLDSDQVEADRAIRSRK